MFGFVLAIVSIAFVEKRLRYSQYCTLACNVRTSRVDRTRYMIPVIHTHAIRFNSFSLYSFETKCVWVSSATRFSMFEWLFIENGFRINRFCTCFISIKIAFGCLLPKLYARIKSTLKGKISFSQSLYNQMIYQKNVVRFGRERRKNVIRQ